MFAYNFEIILKLSEFKLGWFFNVSKIQKLKIDLFKIERLFQTPKNKKLSQSIKFQITSLYS